MRAMLKVGLALALLAIVPCGCDDDGDDDGGEPVAATPAPTPTPDPTPAPAPAPTPAPAPEWAAYAGNWHGKGFREVWVSVDSVDGTVSMRDNVNPDTQSVPWNSSRTFLITGGPTCWVEFFTPTTGRCSYTHNSYELTRI
jgi:hypothetical protein